MEIDLIALIGQVGFPMAVATYLLVKVDKSIRDLTAAVNALAQRFSIGGDSNGHLPG
jgi:hypothetical protein